MCSCPGKKMSIPPHELFSEIYRRHGHRCPMSTLGGRLGHAARRQFGKAVPSEALRAVYHITTCALDGIRQSTGCSELAGSLEVRENGRHLLTLVDTRDGCWVEVELLPQTLELAGEYRRFCEELELELPMIAEDERAQRSREREALLDALLERLRTTPESELLMIRSAGSLPEEGV